MADQGHGCRERSIFTRSRVFAPHRSGQDNEIWLSAFGPNVYHFAGVKWRTENDSLGRKPGVIGAMREDDHGVQWDASAYRRYSFPDGSLNISVITLALREDRVWLGGMGGDRVAPPGQVPTMVFGAESALRSKVEMRCARRLTNTRVGLASREELERTYAKFMEPGRQHQARLAALIGRGLQKDVDFERGIASLMVEVQ